MKLDEVTTKIVHTELLAILNKLKNAGSALDSVKFQDLEADASATGVAHGNVVMAEIRIAALLDFAFTYK